MWKDDYDGSWKKGTRIEKYSSLPDFGIPVGQFARAVLYKNEDGSRTLELLLRKNGWPKTRVPCPRGLAADFLRRARAEARILRAERREAKRLEVERPKTKTSEPDIWYPGCHEHGSNQGLNSYYSDEMVAIYKFRRR